MQERLFRWAILQGGWSVFVFALLVVSLGPTLGSPITEQTSNQFLQSRLLSATTSEIICPSKRRRPASKKRKVSVFADLIHQQIYFQSALPTMMYENVIIII